MFRESRGAALATLIRVFGDIALAEDAVQDAFVVALERWPAEGMPLNPGGWIVTTARRRAIDRVRRTTRGRELEREAAAGSEIPDVADLVEDDVIPDDQLRLIFTCCHPALAVEHRVALTLRLLGGLDVEEIARLFVVGETAMAKRLVRAKRKIADANIPYRIPTGSELPERVPAVLAVVYLIATAGADDPSRPEIRREGLRLARLVSELMPDEPEAAGLYALVLLNESRIEARYVDGQVVRLADQDRSLWDEDLIEHGQAIVRACVRRNRPGPYQIQAAIQAVHGDATTFAATDWPAIVTLYDQLAAVMPTPIVELNRAIAVAEVDGPVRALEAVEVLAEDLDRYHLYHATRGELLDRIGRRDEARSAIERACDLAASDHDIRQLTTRLSALA